MISLIRYPLASLAGLSLSLVLAGAAVAAQIDVRSYVPAAAAATGYTSYIRIINSGTVATPVSVAVIDGATGVAGQARELTASLVAGAAMTFSAQQIEAALGTTLSAANRSRLRVIGAASSLDVQSFLLQPGGAFNEISAAESGTSVAVSTWVPAAAAASGYVSYLRVINTGSVPTAVTVAKIDPVTGVTGTAGTLNPALPAGAAITYTASEVESALGAAIDATERPRILVNGASAALDVQSFLIQPGGAFTNVSTGQIGSTIDVRTYVPAAVPGYKSYVRIINNGATATPVTAALMNENGIGLTPMTIIASLPANAAKTLVSTEIEAALGAIPAASRPRIRISSPSGSASLRTQSFLLQPGGAYNEVSDALNSSTINVRTYIPAADAPTGYTSYLRVINPGMNTTAVSIALIDGTTGATGSARSLIASLGGGAAQTFTSAQIETALGTTIAAGARPRIQISGTTNLEVQSFLIQPGGAFTEVSGGQSDVTSVSLSQTQASRFLGQASFGPTTASINSLASLGYDAWFADQFAKPQTLHRSYMDAIQATKPPGTAKDQNNFYESFWQQAITGDDQLRQRLTFALSQIFVVSLQDSTVLSYPRGVASFYDTLASNAFGNYRDLLQAVSLHPMMGIYLTSLRNQKETGTRVPDENYAREVMQLFSIGLYELNQDGSNKLVNGLPVETYSNADISGLAKVFTGWSYGGPDKSDTRFFGGNPDPDFDWLPMQSYPKYHSISAKNFLGVSIAAQATANPEASLQVALDRLFTHPNAGPFIGKQLIQRLVSSNPGPAYVARVASVFADNGRGVRGDLKAVVKAVLMDTEARADVSASDPKAGKLREPLVRLANWMRGFNAKSASNRFLIGILDDPLTALSQTAMRSPSVFNFYRPGYVPPNTSIATGNLVAPEFQITGETSVVGYLNFMRDVVPNGVGTSKDVKTDYAAELALADNAEALLDRVNLLLMANQMPPALRTQILAAINSVAISATNPTSAATARKNRVNLAIFLTMASPEYLIQK